MYLKENIKNVYKSRAIIVNNNKILVCKYADLFMLPGGKKEDKETFIDALKRELIEELGIIVDDNVKELYDYDIEIRNYYDRKEKMRLNRHNYTKYFLVEINNIIGYTYKQLSESERNSNITFFYIEIDKLKELLHDYKSWNKKYEYYKNELLNILDRFESKKLIRRNQNV